MNQRFGFRVALAVAVVLANPAFATTIEIGSPGGQSTWQANANLVVSGLLTWDQGDRPPTGVVILLRAGGNAGTITNSTIGTLKDVTNNDDGSGDAEWGGALNITPSNPPLGMGNPQGVPYFVEADATWKGFPYRDAEGNLITTSVRITVING